MIVFLLSCICPFLQKDLTGGHVLKVIRANSGGLEPRTMVRRTGGKWNNGDAQFAFASNDLIDPAERTSFYF